MTPHDEIISELARLGLDPLPEGFGDVLKAVCEPNNERARALVLYRLYTWPERIVALTKRYSISATVAASLQSQYLANGMDENFHKAIKAALSLAEGEVQRAESLMYETKRLAFASLIAGIRRKWPDLVLSQGELDDRETEFLSDQMDEQAIEAWAQACHVRQMLTAKADKQPGDTL